jgi:hypothetical protein
LAFTAAEATPAQAQATQNQAYASVALGGSAWVGAGLALFLATRASALGDYAHVLLLSCVVLVAALALAASVGVGQAVAALRDRTEHIFLAGLGLVLGGLYVGVLLGLGGLALWQG